MTIHSYVFASITSGNDMRYSIRLNGAHVHARDGRLRQWRTKVAAEKALSKMLESRP